MEHQVVEVVDAARADGHRIFCSRGMALRCGGMSPVLVEI